MNLNLRKNLNNNLGLYFKKDHIDNLVDIERAVNGQGSYLTESVEVQNKRIENLVINAPGGKDPMVLDALVDEKGKVYSSLKARVDKIDEYINDISISVKKFGATGDGETDDTESIKDTIAYAIDLAKLLKTRITVFFPSGSYRVTSTINIDSSYVQLQSPGARIFYPLLHGCVFNITASEERMYKQNFKVLDGFFIEGGGERGEETIAIQMEGLRTSNGGIGKGPSHIIISSVNIDHFQKGIVMKDNTYLVKFEDTEVFNCEYCIYVEESTNAGERILFQNCNFYNSDTALYLNSWFDMHFNSCSFDYNHQNVIMYRGNVFIDHSSLETSWVDKYHFQLEKHDLDQDIPTLSITNSIYTFYAIQGYSGPIISTKWGHTVILTGNTFSYAKTYKSRFFVTGDGTVVAHSNNYNRGTFLLSDRLNCLGFDIKSTTDLSLLAPNPENGVKPVIDKSIYATNDASLRFAVNKDDEFGIAEIANFDVRGLVGKSLAVSVSCKKPNFLGNVYLKITMYTQKEPISHVTSAEVLGSWSDWTVTTTELLPIPPMVEKISIIIQSEPMYPGNFFNIDDIKMNIV
ncbi:glycosyl hydrolase family 28-related protein [Bacillus wiedmannii]